MFIILEFHLNYMDAYFNLKSLKINHKFQLKIRDFNRDNYIVKNSQNCEINHEQLSVQHVCICLLPPIVIDENQVPRG